MTAEMPLFATPLHDATPPPKPVPPPNARPVPPDPPADREPTSPPGGGPCTDPKAPNSVAPSPTSSLEIEDGKLLLTEREAAKALSVCQRTLWQLRADGEIPCVRIGRAVRYRPADLHAWVARRRH